MDEKIYFDACRKLAGRLSQENVELLVQLRKIMMSYELSIKHVSYVIATAWHESRFLNVRETFGRDDAQVVRRLNKAYPKKRNKYWLKDKETGHHYYGRGFVCQLTWKDNYENMGKALNIDLVNNPDLALKPYNAALIGVHGMVKGMFTGKKLKDYRSYYGMRRVVNGKDKASLIASYAKKVEPLIAKAFKSAPHKAPPIISGGLGPETIVMYYNGNRLEYKLSKVFPISLARLSIEKPGAVKLPQIDPRKDYVATKLKEKTMTDALTPQMETPKDSTDGYKTEDAPMQKSAFMSLTIWGAITMAVSTVAPPVLSSLGYDDIAVAVKQQDYMALIQIAASAMVVAGRQRAVSKLRWPKITF